MTVEDVELFFRYVTLSQSGLETMGQVRAMGAEFSRVILDLVPPGPEREEALKAVKVATLWSNAAIGFDASKHRGI